MQLNFQLSLVSSCSLTPHEVYIELKMKTQAEKIEQIRIVHLAQLAVRFPSFS